MNNIVNDLTCPITLELFEDPVSVPCCGKACSREALVQHLNIASRCPLCNHDLSGFDARSATKNVLLAGLVETLQNPINADHRWSACLIPIKDGESKAELCLKLTDSKFNIRPSLFIAILDGSGSMSGKPMNQVRTALRHITELSKINDNVKLVMIQYGSGAQEIIDHTQYCNMGGTNFLGAFRALDDVLKRYVCSDDLEQPNNVSMVDVAFLTDGEDTTGSGNERLLQNLRTILRDRWGDNPLRVHAIGFGRNCDQKFLEDIRMTGSVEGIFRYAEPTDDGDALCQKLTGIFDLSSKTSSVPLTMTYNGHEEQIRFPIRESGSGEYRQWVTMDEKYSLLINSQIDNNRNVMIEIKEPNDETFERWLSYCIDQLANELLVDGQKTYEKNMRDLVCSLYEKRLQAISDQSTSETLDNRLDLLKEEVKGLRSGREVNKGRLNDLRFSSLFNERSYQVPKIEVVPESYASKRLDVDAYNEQPLKRYSRNHSGKQRNYLQKEILNHFSDKFLPYSLMEAINKSTIEDVTHKDIDGNNALMLASYCGHSKVVINLLEKHEIDMDDKNFDDETAVTLAIKKQGYHHTLAVLLDSGATITRQKSLQRFAYENGYVRTAEVISNYGSGRVDVDRKMTNDYIRFMLNKALGGSGNFDKERFLDVCLSKMMTREVKTLLSNGANLTLEMVIEHCFPKKADSPDTDQYLDLLKIVLDSNKELINAHHLNDGDTLLITACRKGSLPHVQYLLEQGADVDGVNEKGVTPLWVASFMRYPCIMDELRKAKANIHHKNYKGDSILYGPCCRGGLKIAQKLISWGVDPYSKNTNGDSLVLLACRNGQDEILRFLLDLVDEDFVNQKADIDGFNAIMASAEQDRDECILTLHEYGVDLNQKTDDDNEILGGATALHIASYYDRINALKMLLKKGANPYLQDKNGSTSLHIAVIQGNLEIVKILRKYGNLMSITDNAGNLPLSYCRERQDIKDILTDPMTDVLMRLVQDGFTKEEEKMAIEYLSCFKSIPGCLSRSSVIDVIDSDGNTPLIHSVIRNKYDLASLFVDMSSSSEYVRRKNLFGMDASTWAWVRMNPRMNRLLNQEPQKDITERIQKIRDGPSSHLIFLGKVGIINARGSGIHRRMDCNLNMKASNESKLLLTYDGSDVLEYFENKEEFRTLLDDGLIWSSKVFLINSIARGLEPLDVLQHLTLTLYTNNDLIAQRLNHEIITRRSMMDPKLKEYAGVLYQALITLPPYEGEVFIGSTQVHRTNFKKGTKFSWDHFVSGSTLWKVALENCPSFDSKSKKGLIFLVKSKTGRLVSRQSQHPSDSEVIFMPGTKFEVTNWYHGNIIALGQANIRENTFGVKDIDKERLPLEDLMNSDKALIIEITES